MKKSILASIRRLLFLAGFVPALTAFAQSDEPELLPAYVLSATRTPAALTTTGSYVDTIGPAEIARMQLTSLQSALGGIPGAPMFQSGATGGVTSLFLRGANSNQTLFLVDGIRLNDPNTDYAVYLGGACAGACDSLEVAHGPQSTLYGGEAVGGVLSLRAQRGAGPAAERFRLRPAPSARSRGRCMCRVATGRRPTIFPRPAARPRTNGRIMISPAPRMRCGLTGS